MNINKLILTALFGLFSLAAQAAETRYISDNVSIFMHSGPSTQYRIIGTIEAGEAVRYLQSNPQTNFAEIITNNNKKAWIDGKYLSRQASLKVRAPKLQAELTKTKEALAAINNKNAAAVTELTNANGAEMAAKDADLAAKIDTIAALSADNIDLTAEAERLRAENASLASRLDTKAEDEQHRFLMLGAAILALGLLAGLFIPSLNLRKKKNSGWD